MSEKKDIRRWRKVDYLLEGKPVRCANDEQGNPTKDGEILPDGDYNVNFLGNKRRITIKDGVLTSMRGQQKYQKKALGTTKQRYGHGRDHKQKKVKPGEKGFYEKDTSKYHFYHPIHGRFYGMRSELVKEFKGIEKLGSKELGRLVRNQANHHKNWRMLKRDEYKLVPRNGDLLPEDQHNKDKQVKDFSPPELIGQRKQPKRRKEYIDHILKEKNEVNDKFSYVYNQYPEFQEKDYNEFKKCLEYFVSYRNLYWENLNDRDIIKFIKEYPKLVNLV